MLKLSDRLTAVKEQFPEVADVADKEDFVKVESACEKAEDSLKSY